MLDLASDNQVLRKRLKRLLGQGGETASAFGALNVMKKLENVGKLALIGGAVRDVALRGVKRFHSDLDFVFYGGDQDAFRRLMVELNGVENRFGGFALKSGPWRVDVWALEQTWARKAGVRRVNSIHDLLDCTFFDWDAILYDLCTRTVISRPGYFAALESKVMDINLEENPNPRGAAVRALRRGALWRLRFGPSLTAFTRRRLECENWCDLVELDAKAFKTPVLRHCDFDKIINGLSREHPWGEAWVTEPFGQPFHQLSLPIAVASSTTVLRRGSNAKKGHL